MSAHIPRVSIGMPVYNGERFIEATVESLLSQTFTDFELVISDNASTDSTADIVAKYAANDHRIRYYRNAENVGGSKNWTRVFTLSRAPLFKWAAHDDLCGPTFLSQAVEVLDTTPAAVLCYPRCAFIDANGTVIADHVAGCDLRSDRSSKRVRQLLTEGHTHCFPSFGLVRRNALAKTTLLAPYISSDQPLLMQLALMGEFRELPECLFFFREHPERSVWQFETLAGMTGWYDPTKKARLVLPRWRLALEFVRSIAGADVSFSEACSCYVSVIKWCNWHRGSFKRDLVMAGRQVFARALGLPPVADRLGLPPVKGAANADNTTGKV